MVVDPAFRRPLSASEIPFSGKLSAKSPLPTTTRASVTLPWRDSVEPGVFGSGNGTGSPCQVAAKSGVRLRPGGDTGLSYAEPRSAFPPGAGLALAPNT